MKGGGVVPSHATSAIGDLQRAQVLSWNISKSAVRLEPGSNSRFRAQWRTFRLGHHRSLGSASISSTLAAGINLSRGSMQNPEESLLCHLQSLELELHQPATRGDASRLDVLLHEEFQEFSRSGRTYSKLDVVALLLSSTQPAPIVADKFSVRRLAANVALLTYRSAHEQRDGSLKRYSLRSSIWQRSDTGWQLIFHQGTATEWYEPT